MKITVLRRHAKVLNGTIIALIITYAPVWTLIIWPKLFKNGSAFEKSAGSFILLGAGIVCLGVLLGLSRHKTILLNPTDKLVLKPNVESQPPSPSIPVLRSSRHSLAIISGNQVQEYSVSSSQMLKLLLESKDEGWQVVSEQKEESI